MDKCRVMHVEENNPNQSSLILEPAVMAHERDPEVTVDTCLKSSARYVSAAKKSQQNV